MNRKWKSSQKGGSRLTNGFEGAITRLASTSDRCVYNRFETFSIHVSIFQGLTAFSSKGGFHSYKRKIKQVGGNYQRSGGGWSKWSPSDIFVTPNKNLCHKLSIRIRTYSSESLFSTSHAMQNLFLIYSSLNHVSSPLQPLLPAPPDLTTPQARFEYPTRVCTSNTERSNTREKQKLDIFGEDSLIVEYISCFIFKYLGCITIPQGTY